MTDTERAYLAGIIDGEGCIGIYFDRSSGAYRLTLTVTSTSVVWLLDLRNKWGVGRVFIDKSKPTKNPAHKVQAVWTMTHTRAQEVIKQVLPFLGIKKEQAELALTYRASDHTSDPITGRFVAMSVELRDEQAAIAAKLKALKKLSFLSPAVETEKDQHQSDAQPVEVTPHSTAIH